MGYVFGGHTAIIGEGVVSVGSLVEFVPAYSFGVSRDVFLF